MWTTVEMEASGNLCVRIYLQRTEEWSMSVEEPRDGE